MYDILIPDLAAIEVENAFKRAVLENESQFQDNREMLVDFYLSEQYDLDSYLKTYFNKETDTTKQAKYPHNLVLTQTNITAKIIDKKAKAYLKQPVRYIDGSQNEAYDTLLLSMGIKTAQKLADRLTFLLGDHCMVLIADKTTKKLRIDQPPYYIPAFAPGNTLDPIGVVYPSGRMMFNDKEVETWTYWDEQNHLVFENGTWNPIVSENNPHGCFNAIFTHRVRPFRSHWTRDAQDLIDTNRDVNIALTSINNAFRYHGFPHLVFIGIGEEEAGKVRIGFDNALSLSPSGQPGEKLDAKFLDPEIQWESLMKTIKDRIELISASWNVTVQWEMRGNIASGIALKILSVDNRDDINDMMELYEEFLEVPLFEKIKVISRNISWMPSISGTKLTLDWPEWETLESAEERMLRIKTDLAYNLTNPVRELVRDNPDLSEDAAKKLYLKNKILNKELNVSVETDPLDKKIAPVTNDAQDALENQ